MIFLEPPLNVLTTFVSTRHFSFQTRCSYVLVYFIEGHFLATEQKTSYLSKRAKLSYVLFIVFPQQSATKLVITTIDHFVGALGLMFIHVTSSDYLAAIFVTTCDRELHN